MVHCSTTVICPQWCASGLTLASQIRLLTAARQPTPICLNRLALALLPLASMLHKAAPHQAVSAVQCEAMSVRSVALWDQAQSLFAS